MKSAGTSLGLGTEVHILSWLYCICWKKCNACICLIIRKDKCHFKIPLIKSHSWCEVKKNYLVYETHHKVALNWRDALSVCNECSAPLSWQNQLWSCTPLKCVLRFFLFFLVLIQLTVGNWQKEMEWCQIRDKLCRATKISHQFCLQSYWVNSYFSGSFILISNKVM